MHTYPGKQTYNCAQLLIAAVMNTLRLKQQVFQTVIIERLDDNVQFISEGVRILCSLSSASLPETQVSLAATSGLVFIQLKYHKYNLLPWQHLNPSWILPWNNTLISNIHEWLQTSLLAM